MIVKNYDLNKIINKDVNFYLLYGANAGLIEETINKKFKPIFSNNLFVYDEADIIKNLDQFYEQVYNKSFFNNDKLIIINEGTDKILSIIQRLIDSNPEDLKVIIKCGILGKKSKLRILFEKNNDVIITPFYEDTYQQLANIALNFFKEKKIGISSKIINLIIDKIRGNRVSLNNELEKILCFSKTRKKIEYKEINKLINLTEGHNVLELIDECLIKNKIKVFKIINDNYFSLEDNIAFTRLLLGKLKVLKIIKKKILENNTFEVALNTIKPKIFWKEKEKINQQVKIWSLKEINKLIKKINQIEIEIKKNSKSSNHLIFNFIIETIQVSNN